MPRVTRPGSLFATTSEFVEKNVKSLSVMGHGDTSQVYGIQELYRPAQEPEIDIVAVHGLHGGANKSWTTKSGDICWLKHPDFLPKYINRARVLTWGYNANIMRNATSSERILQHAQTLTAQLHADRDLEDANERPIIFLCHSLGGIVVKRALAYSASRSSSKISHLQSIYTCTFAILFFGTPHNGSSKANLLGSLQKFASLALPKKVVQVESVLVNALEEESETLQNITDQFAPLMSRFRIFFFWEQEKTNLHYTKDYIVDEASAAPILDNTERCGIAADHSGMVKFEQNNSQSFRTVVAALRRYTMEAPQVIRDRVVKATEMLNANRQQEAIGLLRSTWPSAIHSYTPEIPRVGKNIATEDTPELLTARGFNPPQ